MNIGPISHFWNTYVRKKPAVPKPSKVDDEGVTSGEDHETREHSDYSEKKKAEAMLYGPDGEKKPLDGGDHHEKLDVDV